MTSEHDQTTHVFPNSSVRLIHRKYVVNRVDPYLTQGHAIKLGVSNVAKL